MSTFIIMLLAPIIILLNLRLLLTNDAFYQKEFAKLSVYQQIEKEVAISQSKKLTNYLCCGGEIDASFYTQREVLHLLDVRNLFKLTSLLLFIYLAVIIIFSNILIAKKQKKKLFSALKFGSLAGIGAILVLFLFSLANFDILFFKFHQISFTNDLWLLPLDTNLIKLFPQQFFQDAANRIALQSLAMLVIVFLISTFFDPARTGEKFKER